MAEIDHIVDSGGSQVDSQGIPWVEQLDRKTLRRLMFQVSRGKDVDTQDMTTTDQDRYEWKIQRRKRFAKRT